MNPFKPEPLTGDFIPAGLLVDERQMRGEIEYACRLWSRVSRYTPLDLQRIVQDVRASAVVPRALKPL